MQADTLTGGFADPATDAAHAFRSVMEAMARPGTHSGISRVQHPPAPLSPAAGAVLLTLCDHGNAGLSGGRHGLRRGARLDRLSHRRAFRRARQIACLRLAHGTTLGAARGLSDRHVRIPGPLGHAHRGMCLNLTAAGATLRGPGIKDSANLSLPEIAAFQANRAPVPAGARFHFHLWRPPRGIARDQLPQCAASRR